MALYSVRQERLACFDSEASARWAKPGRINIVHPVESFKAENDKVSTREGMIRILPSRLLRHRPRNMFPDDPWQCHIARRGVSRMSIRSGAGQQGVYRRIDWPGRIVRSERTL